MLCNKLEKFSHFDPEIMEPGVGLEPTWAFAAGLQNQSYRR